MITGKTDYGCSMIRVGIDHILRRGRIIISSLNSGVTIVVYSNYLIHLFFRISRKENPVIPTLAIAVYSSVSLVQGTFPDECFSRQQVLQRYLR